MAQGLSQNWRADGPTSRVSQARFVAAQQQSVCVQAVPNADGSRPFCAQHAYRGCPVVA
jgi:hypothetical protein